MLQVYHSNQVERLVDQLSANVEGMRRLMGRRGLFEKAHVVVPNWNLETYLKFEIAARQGVAAHFQFHTLEKFLASIVPEKVRERVQILDQTLVHKLIVDLLLDEAFVERPGLEAVRHYLHAPGGDEDAVDRRRFQLGAELAKLFREYDFSRKAMLDAWPTGRVVDKDPFQVAEGWQRELWLEIFGADGVLSRLPSSARKPVRLTRLLETLKPRDFELPDQVHLFGFSYMARSFEEIFYKLGLTEERICIYALNPCKEYWEDLETGSDEEEDKIESMREEDGLLRPEIDAPALRLWGRPGRDYHRMLNRLSDYAQVDLFEEEDSKTLLDAVQRDILTRAPQRPRAAPDARFDDESVTFFACPGIGREVETIASEIWALMKADDTLRFNEIALIVNNANKEAYQTQIRAVFNDTSRIPHNIVDLAGTAHSRVFEAVELLFTLPFGQFRRRELLRLMTHPNVLARSPEIEARQWMEWCHDLHIVHGAD
ncbi:MAG: exodeoxyribonuclease V subunit gamma, partial [Bradymonadaceae bacterium]